MIELKDASLTIKVADGESLVCLDEGKRKLSVRAEQGHVTAITSANAAASTATIRAMIALWPLDEGFASIDGELLTPSTRSVFSSRICYVPRDVCVDNGNIASIVAAINGNKQAGESKTEMRRTLEELDKLHVGHDATTKELRHMPLSMRRLLLMAAAIGTGRPIIMADSPTDGINDEQRQLVIARLKELASRGKTVVVATCDDQLIGQSDTVVRLSLGRAK